MEPSSGHIEPPGRHIERAPKDLLRYGSRFLEFPEIVRCREVCKIWKEVIDDPQHDNELFGRFTAGEKLGTAHPCFEAAKAAYLAEIANSRPFYLSMNEGPADPVPLRNRKCCNCDEKTILIALVLLCGLCTCCCCCCCCCTENIFPH